MQYLLYLGKMKHLDFYTVIAKTSGPITSWEIDGETVETVSDFILGGSKITADGDYSHDHVISTGGPRDFPVGPT